VSSEKEKAFFKPVRNSESNHNLNWSSYSIFLFYVSSHVLDYLGDF
jgi:hypothetical protein